MAAGSEPQRKPGIDRIKWISLETPDQVFAESLEPELKSSGLEVSKLGAYGGGTVYEVKKGNSVKYFNLVLTATSVGTLIVVWNQPPS